MEHLVFVFGTLKEGFPNVKSNKGVRISGDFFTKDKFELVLIGERFSPWMILNNGNGYHIKGQVFQVDDNALSEMDALERIDEPDGYRKVEITVVDAVRGNEKLVYAYGKEPSQLQGADIREKLKDEYLLAHAKLYRSRYS